MKTFFFIQIIPDFINLNMISEKQQHKESDFTAYTEL